MATKTPKPPIYFLSIGHWALGVRHWAMPSAASYASPFLASLLQFQFFTANEIASSNCLPAASPKQKKGFGEWE
ncbi:hypothetical protein [Nostoc mirabile]|uniref:hypothetical protein n=1 Tax=Nostoc mirabile TaxID=2907820 RepID=UPI001E3C211B|nr:hypothetical protein [Nostoc mirabile]